jgi:hypothetical protein
MVLIEEGKKDNISSKLLEEAFSLSEGVPSEAIKIADKILCS